MHNIVKFDELNSTNTYVKNHALTLQDKTVVTAIRQTNGRGRFDRKWDSMDGGLYFTLCLKPAKTVFLSNLTQVMSLAVCKTLNNFGAQAYIKWPNDVHVNKQKICGILSEAILNDGEFYALALGAGVNVGQKDLTKVGQPAVSLKMLGINISKEDVLDSILSVFFELYNKVLTCGFTAVREDYIKLFPFMGSAVALGAGYDVKGIIKDINSQGQLVLEDENKKEHIVLSGEIL